MRSIAGFSALVGVLLTCTCAAQPVDESAMGPPRVLSPCALSVPDVDGVLDESIWREAPLLRVIATRALPPKEGTRSVEVRCVHTDTHIFFAAVWEDETESVSHKPWVWNGEKKAYEESADREDMFAVAFEHTGPFTADMLSGDEAVWDVWHWKAFRTNPQGYAMDKTHRYSHNKPETKATSYTARNGTTIWIARPQDAGDTLEKSQPAPAAYQGDRVAQYLPGSPTGSAADVRAKGRWSDGWWTLEMSRRLDTGFSDDTTFDPKRSYRMALSVFDRTGEMDKATGVILLDFARPSALYDFEEGNPGEVPGGFTSDLTAGGGPVKWALLNEEGAPSGGNVVAQLSQDRTNGRYPLLIHDTFSARDVDLSVRFKPVSGSVDQAAGLVWRYQDRNNYYIVRANALEDNVVAYKVENGRRSSIGTKGDVSSYGVKVEVPGGKWSNLRVVAVGGDFGFYLNGKKLFEAEDSTFGAAGKIGLWTKADSVTLFDDLLAVALDEGAGE